MDNLTVDEVKMHVFSILGIANLLTNMLPNDSAKTLKNILAITTAVMSKQEFAEFITYMLNTFKDGEVTSDKIEQAINDFAKAVNPGAFKFGT